MAPQLREKGRFFPFNRTNFFNLVEHTLKLHRKNKSYELSVIQINMGSHFSKGGGAGIVTQQTSTTHTYQASTNPVKSALFDKSHSMNESRRVSFSIDANIPAHSLERRKSFEVAAKKVVDVFYAKVLQDPLLAPFFENIDMQTLKRKQEILMNIAFGGLEVFEEFPDLGALHAKLIKDKGLNMKHFDRFIAVFNETMRELDIPDFKQKNVNETFKATRPKFAARMKVTS
eukprot:TRINITY_DN5991_c6_g1_i1.p1 TRINITY_DN5991_c6_g1~~TRINITY_DN5991_c6_g1_i1.p1  ORF type:complete len:248 (-),score=21.01 TRINITY_DN5991_c6_g1_i1:145-834(-)